MKKLILAIGIMAALTACEKEESVQPEPRVKTTATTNDTTMAANEEFIGNWVGGQLCGTYTSVNIQEGRNDTIVLVYGMIEAKITDGKFSGKGGAVWHEGEIIDGKLRYCQKSSGVSCCGTFTKE